MASTAWFIGLNEYVSMTSYKVKHKYTSSSGVTAPPVAEPLVLWKHPIMKCKPPESAGVMLV